MNIKIIAVGMAFLLSFSALSLANPHKKTRNSEVKSKKEKVVKEEVWDPTEVINRVRLARKMLANKKAGYRVCSSLEVRTYRKGKKRIKKSVKNYFPCEVNHYIAVTSKKSNRIKLIRLGYNQTQVDGFVIKPVTRPGYSGGVGRQFVVESPKGFFTLAIKRAVNFNDGSIREVVNTPYSSGLDLLGVRKSGLAYLEAVIGGANAELKAQKVPSWADSGKFVADVIPLKVATVLTIIEHIDHCRFDNENARALIRETLTIVAANREYAYRYSVSSAGARDLFQIIQNTYGRVSRSYPKSRLDSDFIRGMRNHRNAAKASLCLFDADLWYIGKVWREKLKKDSILLGRYLAAAYNCGAPCASYALRKHSTKHWVSHLPAETKIYIKKFNATWKILYGSGEARGHAKKKSMGKKSKHK